QDQEPKESTSSDEYIASRPTPTRQRASRVATELYTLSYLILFSILGTLARLGLQWLTFYPGAPVVFSELWANVAGTLFLGFLSEDRQLFRDEWGMKSQSAPGDEEQAIDDSTAATASHAKVKKTIPLYIGLATGFCGSFTSFSSFVRDIFFALANDLPTPLNHPYPTSSPISTTSIVSRNGGYSFMAVLAVIVTTIALCYSALKVGAHIAIYIAPLIPTLPFRLLRKILDRAVVFLALGVWLGAVFMAIWPPHESWRGQAVFACVFAPVGCLLRFYISLKLNGIISSFPLGTFCVNIFGTAVLGMAFDLQHVRLDNTGLAGGGRVGCQVLQGLMDGLCGALTTVSTWIAELNGLRRGHGYVYGVASVASGLGVLVIVMGSVRWTVGWTAVGCVT
ncbi:CrcB-like protein-domain-containing protein, partial [Clohesyomyces aquaticus]